MVHAHKRNKGFILMAELIAIVVFGVSLLALTKLLSSSMTSADQSVQMSQANWMIQDVLARMSINKKGLRNNEYSTSNDQLKCNELSNSNATTKDLKMVFCNPAISSNTQWSVSCNDQAVDDNPCSINSLVTIRIHWPDTSSNLMKNNDALNQITYSTRI
ncbi:MAG: hypothetical protein V4629_11465 [Pseudomonadota bacterium]